MFLFDRGELYVSDQAGNTVQIGSLTKTAVEFVDQHARDTTQYRFPVKFIGGKTTGTGVSEFARFNAQEVGKLFFDVAAASGSTMAKLKDAYTVDALAYTVTVVPPVGGAYASDLGVAYASTCLPLIRVTGVPGPGQYTNTGTAYTFNSADAGVGVMISYLYTVAGGKTVTITNTYMQIITTFRVVLVGQFGGKQLVGVFNACISHQLSLSLMLEDWTKANFKFEIQSDDNLNVGTISLSE